MPKLSAPSSRDPAAASRSGTVGARQVMSVLHGWTGLIPGWVVFVVFLFGTLAFYQYEISAWMRPEIGRGALSSTAVEKASSILEDRVSAGGGWSMTLPGARGGEPLALSWRAGPTGAEIQQTLDPATGEAIAVRETLGGGFLFAFHYNLHYMPAWVARYLVCIASLAMLLSIVSGVITHKRIFKDYFTLRLDKGQRSWLDGHNVMAVLALPFHLMITYTGLVTLVFIIMPWAIFTGYPDMEGFRRDFRPDSPVIESHATKGVVAAPGQLVAEVRGFDGAWPRYVATNGEGVDSGVIEAWPDLDRFGASYETIFLRSDGEPIPPATVPGAASKTMGVMVDLHAGRFSGHLLRWLYFFSGLVGTAMVATGLILWVKKRRGGPSAGQGIWLTERLNIGVIAGSVAGIAAYFLANRLLPIEVTDRGEKEVAWLFAIWGAVSLLAFCTAPKRAWTAALAVGALLYALVPLVNAATTDRGLVPSFIAGDWVFITFDLSMLVTAIALALIARHLHRRPEDHGRGKRAKRAI